MKNLCSIWSIGGLQEKILNRYRDINITDNWVMEVIDDFIVNNLSIYSIDDIKYELDSYMFSGCSFTGKVRLIPFINSFNLIFL